MNVDKKQQESDNSMPLMVHFALALPSVEDTQPGVTASDSGGTTGGCASSEDANIDWD